MIELVDIDVHTCWKIFIFLVPNVTYDMSIQNGSFELVILINNDKVGRLAKII